MNQYVKFTTKVEVADILLKLINIQDQLILVKHRGKDTTTKMFELMKDTYDKDFVILKLDGVFTEKELQIQEVLHFNGHTLSFVDKKSLKQYKNDLLLLLDTLADVRRKGHMRKKK